MQLRRGAAIPPGNQTLAHLAAASAATLPHHDTRPALCKYSSFSFCLRSPVLVAAVHSHPCAFDPLVTGLTVRTPFETPRSDPDSLHSFWPAVGARGPVVRRARRRSWETTFLQESSLLSRYRPRPDSGATLTLDARIPAAIRIHRHQLTCTSTPRATC